MSLGAVRILVILSILAFFVIPGTAHAQTPGDISKQLICLCGEGEVLDICAFHECSVARAMLGTIKEKLSGGESETEIIQFFVAQYGESVLASPPKRGFNLAAWILPFVAIIAGGVIVYTTVRNWVRCGSRYEGEGVTTVLGEKDEEYEHQLEKELKEFTKRSFR